MSFPYHGDIRADVVAADKQAAPGGEVMTAPEQPTPDTCWRHNKRGSIYRVIGIAESQVVGEPIQEGARAVVYRSETDGSLWLRPIDEFLDGRFEKIAGAQPATPPPGDAGDRARDLVNAVEFHLCRLGRGEAERVAVAALQSERTAAASQARRETAEECARIVEAQDGMQGWKRRIVVAIRALATPQESQS